MGRFVLGLDVGGTTTRCAVARSDAPHTIVARRSVPSPRGTPEQFALRVNSVVASCLRDGGVEWAEIRKAACCVCGITDSLHGVVLDAPNLGWSHAPVGNLFSERWELPCVVENDVNAAALAEYRYGAGQGCRIVVYLTVSTGVAAGIVLDGKILGGAHNAAGELGYFLPDPRMIDHDWMPSGCLETTSAGMGLAREWSSLRGGSHRPDRARDVFAAGDAGDHDAVEIIRRAADHLAQAAVAIGNLIDPDRIVLGGSIALHRPAIRDRITEVVTRTLPFPPDVVTAALGEDAPLVGALVLAADY